MTKKPFILLILDGWGHREDSNNNAIALAKTPVWDELWARCPHLLLSGSGLDVGLPDGQMGNSEVGHMTIGLGRVIDQDLTRISKAIANRSFFDNPVLCSAIKKAKEGLKPIHLMGLFSPGGIHSHEDHFFAVLEMLKDQPCPVYVHAFLDGRDTPPKSAANSLQRLQNWFDIHPIGQIASISGRFYAMDRDKRYERTQLAYDMLTQGTAPFYAANAQEALQAAYARGETDEFVQPTLLVPILQKHSSACEPIFIQTGDTVLFLNFRSDRARQLSYALTQNNFNGFKREKTPQTQFVTMTSYADDLSADVLFLPQATKLGLGEILQNAQRTQLRIAETEKYAHVTFFFNGGTETPFVGEDRILIPSPAVRTYDEKPQMSAPELTDAIIHALEQQKYDVIIANYANADMVGHTGNLAAAVKAIESLDSCLGRIITTLHALDGQALITADHGNAECMQDIVTKEPHTAHTTNLVPLVYVGKEKISFAPTTEALSLADIAPSLLTLINLNPSVDMTGQILFKKNAE